MSRATHLLITAASGLTLAATTVVLVRNWRPDRSRDLNLEKEVAQLRDQVDALKNEQSSQTGLASLSQEVRALSAQTSRLNEQRPAAPAAPDMTRRPPEPRLMDPRTRGDEQRFKNTQIANAAGEKLDAELGRESIDRAWSAGTSSDINAVFKPLTSSQLVNVDCRSSLCRVLIRHDSAEDQHGFAKKILGAPPFDQDVLFRYDFDSTPPKTTLYVARQGVSLPQLVGDIPH